MPANRQAWKCKEQNVVATIPYRRSAFQLTRIASQLQLSNNNNNNNNDDEEKGIPFLASALGITILLATWPLLLTLLRDVNNPTDGFDVDMFMTLKGMIDGSNSNGNVDMSMLTDENYQSIVQLPALSPAEQLVGAFFGPPPPR
ncbi:unnamed protein product [Cylindrotheca closterium]|uniref:Uncharacterized protein n=1 Tax=Cylindrotheca closterium TaxID=2856 RepID=A0AAD2JIZ3_9STRA|nr:unnamed protein product [Cylindrotheca closterium]